MKQRSNQTEPKKRRKNDLTKGDNLIKHDHCHGPEEKEQKTEEGGYLAAGGDLLEQGSKITVDELRKGLALAID